MSDDEGLFFFRPSRLEEPFAAPKQPSGGFNYLLTMPPKEQSMENNSTREGGAYIKHSMSCLSDLRVTWTIDDKEQLVLLKMDAFDSSLVSAVVMGRLHEDYGVRAWRDDSDKDDAWLTRPASYQLHADIAGVRYVVEVVKLCDTQRVAVALRPRERHE
jgi:hypothetical protein